MPNTTPSRHPDQARLAAYALGQLAGADRDALQAHLAQCPACRQALASPPQGQPATLSWSAGGAPAASQPNTIAQAGAAGPAHAAGIPDDLANHPKFEILELLGQGGMGAVYKARHKVMNRVVALKVINAQFISDAKAVERFHREVQAAAKLDHPNIVRAHDADQAGDTHFLVMEFVKGTDLAKVVQQKGPLPVSPACHFIRQAALGLQHAHTQGMVHRDIKPHNLMLTAAGVVKVMDFGLARLAHEEGPTSAGLTGENVLMGTVDYIAPEQAQDAHTADIRADIYSLGCALYHLLAGRPPFAGGTVVTKITGHLSGIMPLAELPATVPEGLRAVLAKMLAKEPAARYQTPAEVAQALLPFVKKGSKTEAKPARAAANASTGAATVAEAPLARPQRTRAVSRSLLVKAGIPLLLLLVLGAVLFLVWRWPANDSASRERERPEDGPPSALPMTFTNDLGMEFVLVPKGKAWLGGGGGRPGETEVEIGHDFYLGRYEVTQEEWVKVTGGLNPSGFKAVAGVRPDEQKRFPVESVSWDDCQAFIQRVKSQTKASGWVYRLPKEVEWEYACRGGPMKDKSEGAFDFYLEEPSTVLLPSQANIGGAKVLKGPCPVGSYKPNRLGLYDMHGNVSEWCEDSFDGGADRVFRGGSWFSAAGFCRAGFRIGFGPANRDDGLGFRLARVPVGNGGK